MKPKFPSFSSQLEKWRHSKARQLKKYHLQRAKKALEASMVLTARFAQQQAEQTRQF